MSTDLSPAQSALLVAPISEFSRSDLALAGGKGANLGELARAGFHVPPGFVITTPAYDRFLQENDLQSRLLDVLVPLDPDHPESVAKISQSIRELFQQAEIPKPLKNKILTVYQPLKNSSVAVRSSATAEDLPEAAFAGQQETFLNVIGEQQLLEAVRACWISLWSERAILYRARQQVNQVTVKLAVVVQTMVSADAAGVMFTANPVSGARDELIIDANPGLGEAVVSGMVTPDHFLVDKRSRRVKEQRLGKREVIIRPKTGGGTEPMQVNSAATQTPALALPAIRQLAQLGIAIERHYGTPQDIEWAWVEDTSKTGAFYILQARPMTALPEPLNVSGPMRMVVPMLAEMWLTRPYPLDMTTFTGTIERAIGNLLATMIGKSAPNPDEAFEEEDGVVVQFKPPHVHPTPSMLLTPWITMWRTRHVDLEHWEADPILTEFITQARALERRNVSELSWAQNLEILHEALALIPRAMQLRERYVPQSILGLAGLWLLLALTRQRGKFGALISGVKTKTTETNQALEDLANQIRNTPTLQDLFAHTKVHKLQHELKASAAGQNFLKQFEAFLDNYGHRETALTISQPTWKDQPENVLGILQVLAETQPKQPESYEAWGRTRDELLAHSMLGSGLLHDPFRKSLNKTRTLFQIREDTHFYATMVQPIIRRVALELGRRLMQAGALDQVEDIFHLRLDELEALGESDSLSKETIAQMCELVARRKTKRESLANKPMVDPRLLSMTPQTQAGGDVILQGTSGSPGIASGPVKIVHDVSEFGRLQAGDVLVAPATNPAWTPLFQRAVAIVVDTGGAASHAAIVAREYGVPAVMGTMNGTQQLQDGQWIQVDGSRGIVVKAEASK